MENMTIPSMIGRGMGILGLLVLVTWLTGQLQRMLPFLMVGAAVFLMGVVFIICLEVLAKADANRRRKYCCDEGSGSSPS